MPANVLCVNRSGLLSCADDISSARQWYEELGGEVVLLGKPANVLYEEALRMLGLRKDEVLAIGDSLQHDIAGAAPPAAAIARMLSLRLPLLCLANAGLVRSCA